MKHAIDTAFLLERDGESVGRIAAAAHAAPMTFSTSRRSIVVVIAFPRMSRSYDLRSDDASLIVKA